jgi:energy-coupling factor transporter ATP-binding protein EcfA2
MARVYVSSTFVDLQECRERVSRLLRQMGHEDVAMEYYVASDQRPVEKCLLDVAACEVYVGLFAWRYGWVVPDNNPDRHSVTEMEYREAVQTGKHCLIFLLHEDAPWPRKFIDRDPERIEQLRNELGQKHLCAFFTSAQDIAGVVGPAVYKWAEAHGHIPARTLIPELDLENYFKALRKRYQRIDLEGLTPPHREEYLQLLLRSVFVEQSVRENPPPVELSKEMWERLRRDKEIHLDDLPEGERLDEMRMAREVYYEKPPRPVLDVLTDSRHPHVVILGDPGSGKSTLSRYVLLSLIDAAGDEKLRRAFDGYLPLLIELRSYVGLCADHKCDTFIEYLEYLGQTEGWHLTASALAHHLKNNGRAVVIFDGLDEIFDPEQREQIMRRIVGFAGDYPNVQIIATSRVIGYRQKILTDADFAHFSLQDLDESQVAMFAERWYDLALNDRPEDARERRERILRAFKESSSIRQLAGNPMLLTIMAIIAKHQELPRERWKLYDHAANVLIEHWDINKHLRDQNVPAEFIGQDEKKEMLRRLAYRMQRGAGGLAGNYIHRDDLQDEFESYLKERFDHPPDRRTAIARAMIQQFRERNFILSLYGANLYGFVHRAFLEYFCASAFVNQFEKTQKLTLDELKREVYGAHWEDRNWHEVLRLICSMIDEEFTGEIIDYLLAAPDQLKPKEYKKQAPWNIVLAIQCLSELKNPGAIAESAKRLLEAVCSLFDTDISFSAYNRFLLEQVATSAAAIGPDWPHRTILASWLRQRQSFNATFVNAEAFGKCIGRIGAGANEIQQVIVEYATHDDAERRFLAVYTLPEGWQADPGTLLWLRDRAVMDKAVYVRYAAVNRMVEHYRTDEQTLPLLRDRAVNDQHLAIRVEAVRAIVKHYRDDERTLPLLRDCAVWDESLSPDDRVGMGGLRNTAIIAIAEYWPAHPDTLPLLRERAENDPTPLLRERAKELADELEAKASTSE